MRSALAVVALAAMLSPRVLTAQRLKDFPTLPAPTFASQPDWMSRDAIDSVKVGDYRKEGAFFLGLIGFVVGGVLSADGGGGCGPVPLSASRASSNAPRSASEIATVCSGVSVALESALFGGVVGATIGYMIGMNHPKWRHGNPDQ